MSSASFRKSSIAFSSKGVVVRLGEWCSGLATSTQHCVIKVLKGKLEVKKEPEKTDTK
jgi:hypothetical protein